MAARAGGPGKPDLPTFGAFLAAVTIAGGNAPAIRYVSCETCELDPFWGAAMRFLFASALFFVIARAVRAQMPRGGALIGPMLFGILQFGAGFGLIYWGLVRAPAGLGQVLIACVPLLTFGFALAHRQERFRWEGLIGAVLSVAGVAVVFRTGLAEGVPLRSMLAILLGGICWAEALIVVKRFPPVHPAPMNAIAMGVGGVVLLALSGTLGESLLLPESGRTWAAQIFLILAGSIGVFWLYVFIARAWTASAASYQLVLIPLVTVPVSALLQDERITWSFGAGSVLVIVGVYIGAFSRRSTTSQTEPGEVAISAVVRAEAEGR